MLQLVLRSLVILLLVVLVVGQQCSFEDGFAQCDDPGCCEQCRTISNNVGSNKFLNFLDRCLMYNANHTYSIDAANEVTACFAPGIYPKYLLVFMLIMPFISEARGKSGIHIRLLLALAMFSVGLCLSLSSWLLIAFAQRAPCECQVFGPRVATFLPIRSFWGMPSPQILVATPLLARMGYIAPQPWGAFWAIFLASLLTYEQLVGGFSSLGQVLASYGIGFVYILYAYLTPSYMRIIDTLLNIGGGILTYFLVRSHYRDVSFSFAIYFFTGIMWQLFACAYMLLFMDTALFFRVIGVSERSILRTVAVSSEYEPLLDTAGGDDRRAHPSGGDLAAGAAAAQSIAASDGSPPVLQRDDGWQTEARGLFILTVALFIGLAVMRSIASQGIF